MSEQEVDRLFELPPEEFTAARNELARRLKDDGDASAAADVKQLQQAEHRHLGDQSTGAGTAGRSQVAAGVGRKVGKAQENALKSGGTGDAPTARAGRRTKALRELTQQAQGILERSGRSAGSTVRDKIASTLRAAAVDDAGRAALKAGRLTGEVKSSGFDVFAGLELPAKASRRSAPAKDDELAERRRNKDERRSKRRELEKRARGADRTCQGRRKEGQSSPRPKPARHEGPQTRAGGKQTTPQPSSTSSIRSRRTAGRGASHGSDGKHRVPGLRIHRRDDRRRSTPNGVGRSSALAAAATTSRRSRPPSSRASSKEQDLWRSGMTDEVRSLTATIDLLWEALRYARLAEPRPTSTKQDA